MSDLPTLDLLRAMTDGQVLSAVMEHRRATRAELASLTGLSKPTVSDSVRRLAEARTLAETGERSTGRGRAGSYYSLDPEVGRALVVAIAPERVVAEALDAFGVVGARVEEELPHTTTSGQVTAALTSIASALQHALSGPRGFRVAALSAADPVDRRTGRLVHLPDAPLLIGDLDPRAVLGQFVEGPVEVDNDVNWAARAEVQAGGAGGEANFVHLHLGEGLGAALVSDGVVQRGGRGMAGEIAHLVTAGPGGIAMPFTQVFGALGLRLPGSTAVDVEAVCALFARGHTDAASSDGAGTLVRAVSGVLAACVALADPDVVVVGGRWGAEPAFLTTLQEEFTRQPRHVPLVPAAVHAEAPLAGAREEGLRLLRRVIIDKASARP